MKFTQIPSTTFQQLQLNAGILLSHFTPATGTVDAADILGATSGGIKFAATPTYSDLGDDVDNCPKNMKELKQLDSWDVKMSGAYITSNTTQAKSLLGAADIDGTDTTKIVPRNTLASTDFSTIWWVGDYSDKNGATNGGFIAIKMINALSTGGFQVQSGDKSKGQFSFEYTAHFSNSAQDMKTVEDIISEIEGRFNAATAFFAGQKDIAGLNLELWSRTSGKSATEAEKYAKQLETLNEQLSIQASVVETAEKAHEAMSAQFGEDSSEAAEYLKTLLEEKVAYQDIADGIAELNKTRSDGVFEKTLKDFKSAYDYLSGKMDLSDTQYELWEAGAGKGASAVEKWEKKLETLTEQQKDQESILGAVSDAYLAITKQYGENSAESLEYQQKLADEQLEYQELLNTINDVIEAERKLGYVWSNPTSTTGFTSSAVGQSTAGVINGFATATSSQRSTSNVTANLVLPDIGKIASYMLPSLIKAGGQNGTPILNPTL